MDKRTEYLEDQLDARQGDEDGGQYDNEGDFYPDELDSIFSHEEDEE